MDDVFHMTLFYLVVSLVDRDDSEVCYWVARKTWFSVEKSLNVVTLKGGKAIKKFSCSSSICRTAINWYTALIWTCAEVFLQTKIDKSHGLRTNQRSKSKKVRLKRKLKAYHERKATLASSWFNAREQLVSALLTRQALPLRQMCVIPFCKEEARGRCLNCSPGQFLCKNHINTVHAGGRSLHQPEIWKLCWRFREQNLLQSPFLLWCGTRFHVYSGR